MACERILFVYFDAGAGHRVVAEAVADAIERNPFNQHDVQLIEFFKETGLSRIESITKHLYNEFLIKHPLLYVCYYNLGNCPLIIRILHKLFIDERFWNSIDRIIEKENPRMCVVVNPHLSECFYRVASRRKRMPILVNLVSDPFSIHSLWLSPNAHHNLLFSEEARAKFIRKGIPAWKIKTFDYPIRMRFTEGTHSREEILARHRFSPEKLTILIYAGRPNSRLIGEIFGKIVEGKWPIQTFLVLGKSDDRRWGLASTTVHDDSSIRVFDYAEDMDELMAASDMIVCKAGPAIIFEAINMKKPMVILSYVPGQEKGNVCFVLRKNFGWYCRTSDRFLHLLNRIINDRSVLDEKVDALERCNISNGAPHIAQFLIDVLANSPSSPCVYGLVRGEEGLTIDE